MNQLPCPFEDYQALVRDVLNKLGIPLPYEDYIQDAYFVYEQCRKRYDSSLAKFSTYFTSQLNYHFRTILRKEHQYLNRITIMSRKEKGFFPDPTSEFNQFYDVFYCSQLSSLESEILHLTLQGYTVDEISAERSVSVSTVKRYRKKIKQKVVKNFMRTE
ncbi:sigma-70 family RNA polymerase sigma factor [Halobacillus sp. K22]|uniref:sigma-70 family RNA polymerase sigma factor n=1 Tax=Halobacillus sp. K22 TaxID=3457431 RepID=UPI003FCD6E6F